MTLRTIARPLAMTLALALALRPWGRRTLIVAVLMATAVPLGCDDETGWAYRGIGESEWRRLAAAGDEAAAEASRVLLLMDEHDCRVAFDATVADLDAPDVSRRLAALETLAREDAYRRWFPEEVRKTLEDRADSWQAPVGDPRLEHWERWADALPRSRAAEGRALMRAMAADPNTALGMSGPRRVDRAIGISGGLRAFR